MDKKTVKLLFDWAICHEKQIIRLDGSLSSITQSVHKMCEFANARYEECESFDGFIRNSVDAVTGAIMTNEDDIFGQSSSLGVGASDFCKKSGEFVEKNLVMGSKLEATSEYVHGDYDNSSVNLEKIALFGSRIVEGEGNRTNVFGEGGQSFEKEEYESTNNLMGLDDASCKKESMYGCFSSMEKSIGGNVEFTEVGSNLRKEEDATIMTDIKTTILRNGESDFIYVSDKEDGTDEENDTKWDDSIVEELKTIKRGNSRKERMLANAWDSVGFDQEDEILMEGEDVNHDSYDVLNDMSYSEMQKLDYEDVPVEILRLVYGNDVYNMAAGKSPYPISCDSPCKVSTKLEEHNHLMNDLIDIFKLRSCNKSFPDNACMLYIMGSKLDPREIIVATNCVVVRRSHMLSLQPERLLDSRIINAMVDILRKEQGVRTPGELKFWWIPTTVSRPKCFRNDIMSDRIEWDPWVGNFSQCEKIYLPICAKRHWFLAVVDMKHEKVFIYDDLTISSVPLATAIVDSILKALDKAFRDEIRALKGCRWSFSSFPVLPPLGLKFGCKGFDCGINVIKRMQAAHNGDKICIHGSKDEERVCVAMQLMMCVWNKVRWSIMNRAISCEGGFISV